jgi:hypothetical protein
LHDMLGNVGKIESWKTRHTFSIGCLPGSCHRK